MQLPAGQYHSLLSELSSKFGCLVCENVRHACRTTTPCCWRQRCGGASLCFSRFLLEHKRGGNVSVVRSSSLKLRTMVVVIMCSSRILEIILQPNKTKLSHNSSTVSIHRRPEESFSVAPCQFEEKEAHVCSAAALQRRRQHRRDPGSTPSFYSSFLRPDPLHFEIPDRYVAFS